MTLDIGKALSTIGQDIGKGVGENVIGPAIAAAMRSPEVQASIRRTVWTASATVAGVALLAWGVYRLVR